MQNGFYSEPSRTVSSSRPAASCTPSSFGRTGRSVQETMPGFPLAMAYVPWQHFSNTYEPHEALQYGTIFPELNMPFLGRKGCRP